MAAKCDHKGKRDDCGVMGMNSPLVGAPLAAPGDGRAVTTNFTSERVPDFSMAVQSSPCLYDVTEYEPERGDVPASP